MVVPVAKVPLFNVKVILETADVLVQSPEDKRMRPDPFVSHAFAERIVFAFEVEA